MNKFLLMVSGVLSFTGLLMAQAPVNDHCADAIELTAYDSESEAIQVSGDTRNATDGALDNVPVCSTNFFRDDVWYKVTFPDNPTNDIYAIKVYYGDFSTDIPDVGIALYNSCDATPANAAIFCENMPPDDQAKLCHVVPNQTIYIRVWSAAGDATNWTTGSGTFRIAVFPATYHSPNENAVVLWGNQPGQGDFNGGLNGWTSEGIQCASSPTNIDNEEWAWDLDGFPAYYFGGSIGTLDILESIKSRTSCDGSAIFDSGFLNYGETGVDGSGTCPWFDHEGTLTSPLIDLSEFSSAGVSLVFNQDMQRFSGGQHFVEYSTDGGTTWTSIEINADKTALTNVSTDPYDGYYNEEFRLRLPGAENSANLRVRFRFLGGAYWWVIDDVRIIETECTNTNVQKNWYTRAPWLMVPQDQVYPFPVLADVLNAGACDQTNVTLNKTIKNASGTEVYNQNFVYGLLQADSLAENLLFTTLVDLPKEADTYTGTYLLTQDNPDFDSTDNTIAYGFGVGGNEFALEDGATSVIFPATSNWNAGVPRSWAYGNFFNPATDVEVASISWGVNNPDSMAGYAVNVVLYQWTDLNNDDVCSFNERKYVGFTEYVFSGLETPGGMINTVLENFENPGDPIIMKAGFGYIAIIEHQANAATDPILELLGNNARAYEPLIFAFSQAYDAGMTTRKFQSSILAIPADGLLAQLDYSDRFNGDWVPVVRIVTATTNTVDNLPQDNLVTTYPNPASDLLQVKLEFSKPYNHVTLRLIDNLGRVVYYHTLNQTVTNHVEPLSLRNIASGNYMLQVETNDGQRTVPVIVIK